MSHSETAMRDQGVPLDDVSGVEEEVEEEAVHDAAQLSSRLIYEVIRRDGEEELTRPLASLLWSGLTAGMLMSFSLIGEAILRAELPATDWRPLVENFGYTFGFLLVMHGRMQLFTENTIATVLPLLARFGPKLVRLTVRLWATVLAANVAGAFVAAGFILWTGAFDDELQAAMRALSLHAMAPGPAEAFFRAMPAGVLIAALVWMRPTLANSTLVIVAFTWLVAAGDFGHIVAGSVEMAYLMLRGELGLLPGFTGFFVPVLLGNIAGGTVVFAAMAWAQVKNEVSGKRNRTG